MFSALKSAPLSLNAYTEGYGFKRIAGEYTRETGEYISHTTARDRLVDV
jgi:hypothetical protein